jgi:hypothetical protein
VPASTIPPVTGTNPTSNRTLPLRGPEHAHRGVPKPRPAAGPENPRVGEDCGEKLLTMEVAGRDGAGGSDESRGRGRRLGEAGGEVAGGMGEAARAEEEAAIGVGRRREGGGRNRIGLRVPAWGKGSGACIFVLTKKREKRRKQRFFVGTDTCTMPHWILRENIGQSWPV